ncbi:MAG TPA: hypothetical protein GXZ36_08530 [Firmicutes bacterium]|nr:hypothetical protein [Bacillota bacterium]
MGTLSRQVFKVGLLTFFLSIIISALFRLTRATTALGVSLFVLLIVILVGIVFDLIGTAVTAAQEKPFHAMASDRVPGARKAIELVRNADRVASFCNDLIGDICGTVSGSISAALLIDLVTRYNLYRMEEIISLFTVGLVAALTVGGKAFGKSLAIRQANTIVWTVARLLDRSANLFSKGNNKRRTGLPKKKRP